MMSLAQRHGEEHRNKKLVSLAAIALSLTGCSANMGADTTCGEYNSMSSSDQKSVLKSILEEKGESTGALSMGVMILSARGFCALSDDSATLTGLDG